MGEFFKGWRRKVGVVTLMMACVLTGIWLRTMSFRTEISVSRTDPNLKTKYLTGLNIQDQGWFARNVKTKVLHQLILSGTVTWRKIEVRNPDSSIDYPIGWRRTDYDAFKSLNQHGWQWRFGDFDFGSCTKDPDESNVRFVGSTPEQRAKSDPHFLLNYWTIPYWSLTAPLTLISLWLLLSKPSKSPLKKIAEPVSAEGT